MEFIWNDGGRAACGFVGSTGDCVTRAIAVATGASYRDVYAELGRACQKSPRQGIPIDIASAFLQEQGWLQTDGCHRPLIEEGIPKGVVIIHLSKNHGRSQHCCTVIDHVVYDTWNATDDHDYKVMSFWTHAQRSSEPRLPATGPKRSASREQDSTQQEFDKILRRLKALDKTANNGASTEGEKRNALRMMQTLMLRHNMTRDDIVDGDNVDGVQFTRMSCPVNGRRACSWEKSLAWYVCDEIFPTVRWYLSTKGHRTIFSFYGPLADVRNSIALFRELLLTIATAAHLQYSSHVRGSGASYAEGYVAGLPRSGGSSVHSEKSIVPEPGLIQTRTLALHQAATDWLRQECNISLTSSSHGGRHRHDPTAESRGKQHGAKHKLAVPGAPKRISQRGG